MITKLRREGDNDRTSSRKKRPHVSSYLHTSRFNAKSQKLIFWTIFLLFSELFSLLCGETSDFQLKHIQNSKLLGVRNFNLRLIRPFDYICASSIQIRVTPPISLNNGRSRRCIRVSVSYLPHDRVQINSRETNEQFGSDFEEETSMQKFKRRLKEEPLIPLGTSLSFLSHIRKMLIDNTIFF